MFQTCLTTESAVSALESRYNRNGNLSGFCVLAFSSVEAVLFLHSEVKDRQKAALKCLQHGVNSSRFYVAPPPFTTQEMLFQFPTLSQEVGRTQIRGNLTPDPDLTPASNKELIKKNARRVWSRLWSFFEVMAFGWDQGVYLRSSHFLWIVVVRLLASK